MIDALTFKNGRALRNSTAFSGLRQSESTQLHRFAYLSRFFRSFIKLLGKVMMGKKENLLFKNPILSH